MILTNLIELLQPIDFTSLIKLKFITSLAYLVINYITYKQKFPVTLANSLRLLVGPLDFMIVITLLLKYTLEWGILAYGYPAIGVLSFIFIFGLNWIILLRQNGCVQPVFIIGLLSLAVLVMLNTLFFQMGLGYKAGAMPALMLYNGVYMFCWLVFYPNTKMITTFAEGVGDKLFWVDPLIGNMPHEDVVLRNVRSFNLSLLNFTYIHTSLGGLLI